MPKLLRPPSPASSGGAGRSRVNWGRIVRWGTSGVVLAGSVAQIVSTVWALSHGG